MTLPKGITGLNVPRNLIRPDESQFVADCWAAVNPFRGRVEELPNLSSSPVRSYHSRIVRFEDNECVIVLNAHYPWIGFCELIQPGTCLLDFVDVPKIGSLLATTGRYRVLEKEELERPLTERMCSGFGRGELKEIRYWDGMLGRGMMRVGDVIFNFWD